MFRVVAKQVAWRKVSLRWLSVLLLCLSLAACTGGTGSGKRLTTENLSIQIDDVDLDISTETRGDLKEAFSILSSSSSKAEERALAYEFISDVNLLVWNDLRARIDILKEGDGNYKSLLRTALSHFMKAQWARSLYWKESQRANDVYGDTPNPYEGRYANAWSQYERPEVAEADLKKILAEMMASDKYIDLKLMSELRYSLAIFHVLKNTPLDALEPVLEMTHDNEEDALRFALDVAYLYERLNLDPGRAANAYNLVSQYLPGSRTGYEAQVRELGSLWKKRYFYGIKEGNPSRFDQSAEGKKTFSRIKESTDMLLILATQREGWPASDKENVGPVDDMAEEILRSLILHLLSVGKKDPKDFYFMLSKDIYQNYNELFPYNPYNYQLTFQLAKLYDEVGLYDEAFKGYKAAFKLNQEGPNKKDIVRSMMKVSLKRAEGEARPKKPKETRESFPELTADYLDAAKRYFTTFEDKEPEKAWAVRYEVALLHYLYGVSKVAEPIFEDFVIKQAQHPLAGKAAVLYLDLIARRYKRSRKKSRMLLDEAIFRVEGTGGIADRPEVKKKLQEVKLNPPKLQNTF